MHIKNNIILSSSIQCRLINVSENWKSILYASLSKWIFADLIDMCDSCESAVDCTNKNLQVGKLCSVKSFK